MRRYTQEKSAKVSRIIVVALIVTVLVALLGMGFIKPEVETQKIEKAISLPVKNQ